MVIGRGIWLLGVPQSGSLGGGCVVDTSPKGACPEAGCRVVFFLCTNSRVGNEVRCGAADEVREADFLLAELVGHSLGNVVGSCCQANVGLPVGVEISAESDGTWGLLTKLQEPLADSRSVAEEVGSRLLRATRNWCQKCSCCALCEFGELSPSLLARPHHCRHGAASLKQGSHGSQFGTGTQDEEGATLQLGRLLGPTLDRICRSLLDGTNLGPEVTLRVQRGSGQSLAVVRNLDLLHQLASSFCGGGFKLALPGRHGLFQGLQVALGDFEIHTPGLLEAREEGLLQERRVCQRQDSKILDYGLHVGVVLMTPIFFAADALGDFGAFHGGGNGLENLLREGRRRAVALLGRGEKDARHSGDLT
mmetsp:Transcript_78320/g.162725  ORF Transcript_78320/g.162725 Transcript_78320/m.162725 type:complete len:364 (-) Transcript_78320:77-1168(-)